MEQLNEQNIRNLPKVPGVYKIYACKNNKPVAVPRLFKKDKSGLLYIGKGEGKGGARTRLKSFWRRANGKKAKHPGGWKFLKRGYAAWCAKEGIVICFSYAKHKHALSAEKSALKAYEEEFGESPPLNA